MRLVRMAISAFLFQDIPHVDPALHFHPESVRSTTTLRTSPHGCTNESPALAASRRARHDHCSSPLHRPDSRCSAVMPDRVASTMANSRRLRDEIHIRDAKDALQAIGRDFHGAGRWSRTGRGLRKRRRHRGVEHHLPSTFCITWWMWPFSTVTDPKRFIIAKACSLSDVPQPHSG